MFDIDPATGGLSPAGDLTLPHPLVEGVTQIQVHPTAPWLLLSATGGASGLQDQLMPLDDQGRPGMAKVISTDYYGFTWDPSGHHFYGLDGVALGQFVFDPAAGALQPQEPLLADGSVGHQFLWLKVHPSGRWVYSVEEGALGRFAVDTATGALTAQEYVGTPLPAESTSWTSLAVHPSGRFLYCLGQARDTQLGFVDVYGLDGNGRLSFVTRERGDDAHQIHLDSLQAPLLVGDHLIVGGRGAAAKPVLVVYRIAADTGLLTAFGDPVPLAPAATAAVNFLAAVH
jgi:hypothetical protein